MPDVYASVFEVVSPQAAEYPQTLLDAIRDWVGDRWPSDHQWFQADLAGAFTTPEGNLFRWEPYRSAGSVLYEFTWRHPHVSNPDISWYTQAAMYGPAKRPRLSLRVFNSGPDLGQPGALLTSRPRLLLCLVERMSLRWGSAQLSLTPRSISGQGFSDFVRYELFSPDRRHPAIVLTPDQDGSYAVSPDQIHREYLGLGEVCVAESAQATFALTDELARRELSCFRGAMRVYLPKLKRDDDPFRHPLILPRLLGHREVRSRLAMNLAVRAVHTYQPDSSLYDLRDERAVHQETERRRQLAELADARDRAREAADLDTLELAYARSNDALIATVAKLNAEIGELKENLRDREQAIRTLTWHLGQKSEAAGDGLLEEPQLAPSSVGEAVELAQVLLSEHLLILGTALEAALDSPFTRPELVWPALRALAEVSRAKMAGPLGRPIRDVLRDEHGQDYAAGLASTTSDKIRLQYCFVENGATYCCEEHLRVGGSSRDPAECLRIYFSSSEPDKIVVGHVGRHLDVIST